MTREEAIKNIKEHCYFANLILPAKEALDMAIKALEQEPCEDAINRQAVLDKMKERDEELSSICPKDIKDLPSVTPQPNTGYWEWKPHPVLPYTGNWYCSECNLIGSAVYDYCPSCGAKMQEVEE